MSVSDTKPSATATRVLQRERAEVWTHRKMRVVLEGATPELGAELGAARTRIGTAEDNELRVDDASVSAHHCEIVLDPRGAQVRDLGSTNGTFVDGVRVERAYLGTGSLIEVGKTRLVLVTDADEVSLALSQRTNFGSLLGHSPKMRAAFGLLEQAAKTEATVLILGESGTGKELAARGLHEASPRRDHPYIVFDCGAASPSLIESALFGHARGAFTGATEARPGVFEQADGGTLVLDEIGELPLDLQPKLLRVLESRSARRLGESTERRFDVRFVASTNRNLLAEVKAQRFRGDLYYRLSVITVTLPPLRERLEELPRLVAQFARQLGGEKGAEIAPQVLRVLASHDWPGNVRELRNVVERLVTFPGLSADAAVGRAPSESTLAVPDTTWGLEFHAAKEAHIEAFERAYLERRLAEARGNVSEAARTSGLSRQSIHRLINKYGLGSDG